MIIAANPATRRKFHHKGDHQWITRPRTTKEVAFLKRGMIDPDTEKNDMAFLTMKPLDRAFWFYG